MTDLFSQFIKDASVHSPFYPEDDDYLVREEDNKKRIEEEQRKIEELQKTEQEKLQDIQETLEEETIQPDNLFSSFINDASQVTVNETLDDIPISRKVQFGAAQEPTIGGSLFRLGEAGINSLFSNESFSEAAQRIEAERQKKIFEEFPEFYGRQEDLTVLSGRMGVAIADPVTFFIPWVKIAKAGRIATIAAGSSVAAGEALLREKALYGEVSPAIIAASAGLGGVSTGIGSLIASRLGGGKINQVLHTDAQVNQNVSSDTELMSLAITPSASNSKVYMLFNGTAQMNANEYASFDFYRGSLSSGTKILDGGETLFNGQDNVRVGFSMSMLDSPNTTSQVTYTVVGVPLASGTIQFGATARNTLTLMEVLA